LGGGAGSSGLAEEETTQSGIGDRRSTGAKETGKKPADKEVSYENVSILDTWKDPAVRIRLQQPPADMPKIQDWDDDDKPDFELTYARPTKWFELPNPVNIPSDNGSEVYAGTIEQRQIRIRDENADIAIHDGDPSAELVTAVWSDKYQTRISAHRAVKKGDFLNFVLDKAIHVIHPIDWTIRQLKEYKVDANAVVVDIIGGEKLPLSKSILEYTVPGELLVMNVKDGTFVVLNVLDDRTNYRHSMLMEDESSEIGEAKKLKEKDEKGSLGPG